MTSSTVHERSTAVNYVDPVYIKHKDFRFVERRVTATLICSTIDHCLKANATIGAQHKKQYWEVFASDHKSREILIDDGFTLFSTHVTVYPDDPIDRTPTEKLVIRDIPMQFPDEEILQFLIKAYPEHTFKSRVFKARDELSRYKYSKYYTGDRIVYVQAPFLRPFPYKGFVDNFECRFWHPSQHARCKRCKSTNHATENVVCCPAYADDLDIRAIRDPTDPLCNYFLCDMTYRGVRFSSSEHAYQYEKCKQTGYAEAAAAIMKAPFPKMAKEIANKIPRCDLKEWKTFKDVVMYDILDAKSQQVPMFKQALIDSGDSLLVEATSHEYWACGFNVDLATTTSPKYYPGHNVMGSLLMKVRSILVNSLPTNPKNVEKPIVSTNTAPPTIDSVPPIEIQSSNLDNSISMSVASTEDTGVESDIPVPNPTDDVPN